MDHNADVLLVYPPVTKPASPPAGVAYLKSALQSKRFSCRVIDANADGLNWLLQQPDSHSITSKQTRTLNNLKAVKNSETYADRAFYKQCVTELNRDLYEKSAPYNARVSLTDFKQKPFLPVRSGDLLLAAKQPEQNPFYSYFEKELIPRIRSLNPKLVGFSINFLNQAVCAFTLIGMLRSSWSCDIVVGGGLITSWMNQPQWDDPFAGLVDACLPGRGEVALLNYLGSTWPPRQYIKPDFTDFYPDDYFSPYRVLPYTSSHGCYWRKCKFCPEHAEKNAYVPVPHHQVFDDINELVSEYQFEAIHFLDNALSPALLRKIAQRTLPVPWFGYVRFIRLLENEHFCEQLRASGCSMLQLGLESGDQRVLDSMQKGISIGRMRRILENVKNAGIDTFVYVLFGTPYESRDQAERTFQFLVKHSRLIDYINPAIFNLPVFSEDSFNLKTRPFYPGDLSLYVDFEHPAGWDRRHVRQFLKGKKTHPIIADILRRNPVSFTSNHAPFFSESFSSAVPVANKKVNIR